MQDREQRLLAQLRRDHAALLRRVSVLGGVRCVAGTVLLVTVATLLVGLPFTVDPIVRRLVLGLLIAGLIFLLWTFALRPIAATGNRATTAGRIDRALDLRNALVVVEERERTGKRGPDPTMDAALHGRLIDGLAPRYSMRPAPTVLDLPYGIKPYGFAIMALVIAAVVWVSAPDHGRLGFARLMSPGADLERPLTYTLVLEPWHEEVIAGGDISIAALGEGHGPESASCEFRTPQGGWKPLKTEAIVTGGAIRYQTELRALNEDVIFRFRRGRIQTLESRIRVLHPPLPTAFTTTVIPPSYTGIPKSTYDPTPSVIEVPAGSRLVWEGRISHAVVSAALIHEDGDTTVLVCEGPIVGAERLVTRTMRAEPLLMDAKGLVGGGGVSYEIRTVPDRAPSVQLIRPDDDGRLPPDGRLLLAMSADDDYGLRRPELQIRRESQWNALADTNWTALAIPPPSGVRDVETPDGPMTLGTLAVEGSLIEARYNAHLELDLGEVELLPGDAIHLRARVRDNREPGPGMWGHSRVLRFTVPSAVDLLTEQVETAEERMSSLDDIRDRSEAIAEELARIQRELKKNPETDFARRQEMEEALARQRQLQDELDETSEELRQDLDRMAERNMVSPELMEKMDRVAELLEEVQDEELRRLQDQLREAMNELSPEDVRRAMEEVAERQEEFLERLDRVIALLEDLQHEQELAALASQVEEMMRTQEELIDAQADSTNSDGEGESTESDEQLAERQESLADELAELDKKLEEMVKDMSAEEEAERSAAEQAMLEALEQALEELRDGGAEQEMRDAAGDMPPNDSANQDNPAGDPGESQHESMRKLASLYHVLMQGQQNMQMAMEQFASEALKHLAHDLLTLSERQEVLAGRIPVDLQGVHTLDLTREEMRVQRATISMRERLNEVLRQSPSLSAKLLNSLDEVIEKLDVTVSQLRDGWGRSAGTSAREGLGSLNNLVTSLLTSPQMSGSGGGSCPMPSLGQQLEQMAREQAGLNSLTDQMRQGGGQQGLSQEMRAQMERLQGDQQGLAGRMHETAEEQRVAPEGERLLGDLEELARDMERVADQLSSGEIDDEILRRQERILSRLLDARNSVRRRDYERRRESATGRELFRPQVGDPLDDGQDEEREALSVRRRQMEHVPPDYRDLVRRYFRALPDPKPVSGEVSQ